eukprot:scaffold3860_cov39-Prasinocladus_malaysianus.AAC.1
MAWVLKSVAERGDLVSVALNTHGTRAVQKLIETLAGKEQVQIVIEALRNGVVSLIKESIVTTQLLTVAFYGNYVVQYVLELGQAEHSAKVMNQLFGHYAELSVQKFSSNVVEKCLKLGGRALQDIREQVRPFDGRRADQ